MLLYKRNNCKGTPFFFMTKSIFIVLVALWVATNAYAQTSNKAGVDIVTVPGYNGYVQHIGLGDSIRTVITNSSSDPVSYFIPYQHAGLEYIAYSEDSTKAAILRGVSSNEQDSMMAILLKVAQILKSNVHINAMSLGLSSDAYSDSALCSTIGGFNSIYHEQCNNFARQAANLVYLASPNLFNSNTVRMVSLPDHAVIEVYYKDHWTMFDYDAGMPVFMVEDSHSPNGLASVADVVADTSLINSNSQYLFNSYKLGGDHSIATYQRTFEGVQPDYYPVNFGQKSISGVQTLCAGCKLTFTAKVNTLPIDTSTIVGRQMLSEVYPLILQAWATQDPIYWDSMALLVVNLYGLSAGSAHELFSNKNFPKIKVVTEGEDWWQSPSSLLWSNTLPTCNLDVPSRPIATIIGRDVKMPFLVTAVTGSQGIIIGGALQQNSTNELWLAGALPPQIEGPQAKYFVDGTITKYVDSLTVTMAYNPEVINIYKGFNMEQYGGTPLTVTQEFVAAPKLTPTGMATVASDKLKVYPTLVKHGETINMTIADENGTYGLYSLSGQELLTGRFVGKSASFDAPLATGLYVVKVGNSATKVLVVQ